MTHRPVDRVPGASWSDHPCRVFSFDGGGVRGIYAARHLEVLQERTNLLSDACLYAGTSTGAIIAVGLALGMSGTEIVALYRDLGPMVFHSKRMRKILRFLSGKAAYSSKALRQVLDEKLQGTAFGDCSTRTIITAVALDTHRTVLFDSKNAMYEDISVTDILMASTAAPFYFPPHRIEATGIHYLDGGLACNNPAHKALLFAECQLGASPDEICLMSIGTGGSPKLERADKLITERPWARLKRVVNTCMDTSSNLAHTTCQVAFGDDVERNYRRYTPSRETNIELDDYETANKVLYSLAAQDADDRMQDVMDWCKDDGRTGNRNDGTAI